MILKSSTELPDPNRFQQKTINPAYVKTRMNRRTVMKSAVGQSPPETIFTQAPRVKVPFAELSAGARKNVVRIPIGGGSPDAHQIVGILQNLSVQFARSPVVREATAGVLGATGNHLVDHQIHKISKFVRNNVKYVADPTGAEYVLSPVHLLNAIEDEGFAVGDCDDHVLLLNSMLGSLGLETLVVGVKLYATDRFDHVISSVMAHGKWRDIDPCVKGESQPAYNEKLLP